MSLEKDRTPQSEGVGVPRTTSSSSLNTPTPVVAGAPSTANAAWAVSCLDPCDHEKTTEDPGFEASYIAVDPLDPTNSTTTTEQHETVVTFTLEDSEHSFLFQDGILPENTEDWNLEEALAPVSVEQQPDDMRPVDPCTVEGLENPKNPKNRKGLRLLMPESSNPLEEEEVMLDTPALESVLDQEVELSNFDLLDFVVNSELPVNDPSFMNLIGEERMLGMDGENASNLLSTLDTSELDLAQELEASSSTAVFLPPKGKRLLVKKQQQAKQPKRRGRPPSATVTSDHAYEPQQQPQAGPSEARKYRRMRDLNNIASKTCRQNRKRKFKTIQGEEDDLIERNADLRAKCKKLDDVVKKLKAEMKAELAKLRRQPLDLDALMAQRLNAL